MICQGWRRPGKCRGSLAQVLLPNAGEAARSAARLPWLAGAADDLHQPYQGRHLSAQFG